MGLFCPKRSSFTSMGLFVLYGQVIPLLAHYDQNGLFFTEWAYSDKYGQFSPQWAYSDLYGKDIPLLAHSEL